MLQLYGGDIWPPAANRANARDDPVGGDDDG